MMINKFRKKPVVIEAVQFIEETKDRVFNFITCNAYPKFDGEGNPTIKLQTLNGDVIVTLGEWIIKGINGEFYPCSNDIFQQTYEAVGDGGISK